MMVNRPTLMTFVMLMLVVSLFYSCSEAPVRYEPEPERAEFIRPLTIGSQWFGTRFYFGQDGTYDTTRTSHTVVGDTIMMDEQWSEIYHDSDDTSEFAITWSSFLRNDSIGLWETITPGRPGNLLAKYPAVALDTFTIVQGVSSVVVVASIDTMLKVPAGEFSCYNYQYFYIEEPSLFLRISYFFAPGVGMIKSDSWELSSESDTIGSLETSWELDSFNLVVPDSNIIVEKGF